MGTDKPTTSTWDLSSRLLDFQYKPLQEEHNQTPSQINQDGPPNNGEAPAGPAVRSRGDRQQQLCRGSASQGEEDQEEEQEVQEELCPRPASHRRCDRWRGRDGRQGPQQATRRRRGGGVWWRRQERHPSSALRS